jgi:hypothetical protein
VSCIGFQVGYPELQVFESAIKGAEQRLAHSLRSIMGGDTKEVSHRKRHDAARTVLSQQPDIR